MSVPPVTLALPVYNGENFVAAAIESLLAQTFRDFELIVSDNASTDTTWDISQSFARRDPRIRLHRFEANAGATRNFNHALAMARGRYFKWCAHDDLIEPTFVDECIRVLDADPSSVLVYSRARIIDENGARLDPGDGYDPAATFGSSDPLRRFRELIRCRHRCFPVFGVIRTEVLRRVGALQNYSHADRILVGRLAMEGRFHQVPKDLFLSRVHATASARLFADPRKLRSWWDPNLKRGHLLPHWKLFWEYLRLVRDRIPGTGGQLRGYAEVITSLGVRWWRRKLISDLMQLARTGVR
jgi:glycosyltransferase involved in cell wall biosynthesis